jgi:hypothetical protein
MDGVMTGSEKIRQRKFHESDSFGTLVADVNKKNEDGSRRQQIIKDYVGIGHFLELKREPNNPKNSDAISIWWMNYQIGYLGDYLTEGIGKELDAGHPVSAVVTKVDTEDEESNICNVYFELSTGRAAEIVLQAEQERLKTKKNKFSAFGLVFVIILVLAVILIIIFSVKGG